MNTTAAGTGSAAITDRPAARQLRPVCRRQDTGVASGIAHCLNADVTLARVSTAALALFTAARVGPLHRRLGPDPADGEDQPIAAAWIAGRQYRSR
jgi:hypothetical protein